MFMDRREAGQQLAKELMRKNIQLDLVVGIPRGGVVVAAPVASYYDCPLDVVASKKIGHPRNPEVAIGAVTPDCQVLVDKIIEAYSGFSQEILDDLAQRVGESINRDLYGYRAGKKEEPVIGKRVLIVDDGIATGFTVLAAVQYLRRKQVKTVGVAVPVSSKEAHRLLAEEVDFLVALEIPERFLAVGYHYQDFSSISREEVIELLAQH